MNASRRGISASRRGYGALWSIGESDGYSRELPQRGLASANRALRAARPAMPYVGAEGYLQSAPAQRKLRGVCFVAIVFLQSNSCESN